MLESGLRVFGVFEQPALFHAVQVDGDTRIQINSNIGERYFDRRQIPVPTLYPQAFSVNKEPGTYRIFCLGGSTTAGFPYDLTVPFPQQLAFLLEENRPDINFEVINLGLSAINSFTVWDWMDEILAQDPDLILIYMGHNEFYGAYGTGSAISFGKNGTFTRMLLKVQRFNTIQMLTRLVRSLTPAADLESNPTIMEKIVSENLISADSDLRQVTAQNFTRNLELILENCQAAEVPVVMAELVSNLKDLPPFGDSPGSADSTARQYFEAGQAALVAGDTVQARSLLVKARDQDAIPFRASSELNNSLHALAAEFQLPLVELTIAFARQSREQIPGDDLFIDHLHPNPLGYRLMALEFLNTILNATTLLPGPSNPPPDLRPDYVTDLDWEIGALRVYKLKHRWPFAQRVVNYSDYPPAGDKLTAAAAKSFLFEHNNWGRAHAELAEIYLGQGFLERACYEFQAITVMFPEKRDYHEALINTARRAQFWPLLAQAADRALDHFGSHGWYAYNLAVALRMQGDLRSAMAYIQTAIEAPELTRNQSLEVYYTYALFLLDLQQSHEAINVLSQLTVQAPDFIPARELLNDLQPSN